MDYVIDLDPTHHVIRLTVTMFITDEALTDIYWTLKRIASRGGPYAGVITDLSQVVDFHLSSSTIRTLAAIDPPVPGRGLRVIVAREPAAYGFARMFELYRDSVGVRVQVVPSINAAYESLEVRPEDFTRRLFPEDLAA